MTKKLTAIYEDLVVLDACINLLNTDLGFIRRCRELINSSPTNSDIYEDYLRLSKNETAQLYEKITELLFALLENIDTLNQIPKTHWYSTAIAFIVDDYSENKDLSAAVNTFNKSIEELTPANPEYESISSTIKESQNNAIARTTFIKSILDNNEQFAILIPEIEVTQFNVTGNSDDSNTEPEIKENTKENIKEEKPRKTILEILKGNRGE